MNEINEELLEAVDALGAQPWTGECFRHTAPEFEPLSGFGSFLFGGRWNPPDLVATIYLAFPEACCVAEFLRMAEGQGKGPESFIPRDLHAIDAADLMLLDVTSEGAMQSLRINLEDIRSDDWTKCQQIGEAHFVGLQGILTPSATDEGFVIAAFEPTLRPGQLAVRETRPMRY